MNKAKVPQVLTLGRVVFEKVLIVNQVLEGCVVVLLQEAQGLGGIDDGFLLVIRNFGNLGGGN